MSQANVEIVRSMWDPFKGLDTTAIDWDSAEIRAAIEACYSPRVELNWAAGWVDQRTYHGRAGVIRAFREWVEPFSEYYVEVLDYIQVGDRVVVPTRQKGVGKVSKAPVEIEVTHVYAFEDGLVTRLDEYETREEALAAARKAA